MGNRRRPFRRSRFGRGLTRIPFYLLVALIFIYALFPFLWALRSAFTPDNALFSTPLQYFPKHPTLDNFRGALDASFFRHALLNSTIVAGSVTLLSLAIGSLAAYALDAGWRALTAAHAPAGRPVALVLAVAVAVLAIGGTASMAVPL